MKGSMVRDAACALLGSVLTLAAVFSFRGGVQDAAAQGGGPAVPVGNGDVDADGYINITDTIYILNWLFRGGPAPVAIEGAPSSALGLPATGQMLCYDGAGTEIPCNSATCAGQDGLYATGCANNEHRFIDNPDGTVTDTCTGLMWQQDTGNDETPLTWCSALAYCEDLSLAGHDDWRLPDVRELQSIVDYGRFSPSIDPVFGASSSFYWSSTSIGDQPGLAWLVGFLDGYIRGGGKGKALTYFVRAVRTIQPGE